MDIRLRKLEKAALAGDKDAAEQLYRALERIAAADPTVVPLMRKLSLVIRGRKPLPAYQREIGYDELIEFFTGDTRDEWLEKSRESLFWDNPTDDEILRNYRLNLSNKEKKHLQQAYSDAQLWATEREIERQLNNQCESWFEHTADLIDDAADSESTDHQRSCIENVKWSSQGVSFNLTKRIRIAYNAAASCMGYGDESPRVGNITNHQVLLIAKWWADCIGNRFRSEAVIDFGFVNVEKEDILTALRDLV